MVLNHTTEKLDGHSGCIVEKHSVSQSDIYVRKYSSDIEYNKRLRAQVEKQRTFVNPFVKTPEIIRTDYASNGIFYYDMDFIDGAKLSDYIKASSVDDIISILKKLMTLVPYKESEDNANHAIARKIESLESTLKDFDSNSLCKQGLNYLKSHRFGVHPSFCHGDLTFENVIISQSGDIYLIDFLDSFCNCYEVDISKLLQDSFSHWSFRKEKLNDATSKKLKQINDFIENEYMRVTHSSSCEPIYLMLLLTLIRIYPYSLDDFTIKYLDKEVQRVLDKLQSLNLNKEEK